MPKEKKGNNDIEESFSSRQSQLATILIGILIIIAGFLIFSYFRTSPEEGEMLSQEVAEETEAEEEAIEEKKGEVMGFYTVKSGDTLSEIAKEVYGNSENWREIARANQIPEDSPAISPGQKLSLPAIGGPGPEEETLEEEPSEEEVKSEEAPATAVTTYVVQRGDTLWEIAENFYGNGTEWHKIWEANNLSMYRGFPLIHSGNVLVIP